MKLVEVGLALYPTDTVATPLGTQRLEHHHLRFRLWRLKLVLPIASSHLHILDGNRWDQDFEAEDSRRRIDQH
jgi:hypothetical protein